MLQREGWVEEFVGWEGLGEHESGAPALEGGGGEADYYLGVGVSWGGSRCEPARGGKKGGVCVCVCVCVCRGGGGLHLATRQEMKTCSDQEQRLRTASSFLLRHQLSRD